MLDQGCGAIAAHWQARMAHSVLTKAATPILLKTGMTSRRTRPRMYRIRKADGCPERGRPIAWNVRRALQLHLHIPMAGLTPTCETRSKGEALAKPPARLGNRAAAQQKGSARLIV